MRRDAGLGWEQMCGKGLKSIPGNYAKNSNSLSAECDHNGCYQGLSWRFEEKETSKPNLPFSVISKNQKAVLRDHDSAGGFGLIAIRYVGPGAPKGGSMYGLTYSDFVAMGGTTRPGSVALYPDPAPELIPLEVVEKFGPGGKSMGRAIDFRPVMEEALRVHYDRLTGLFEGVEDASRTKKSKLRYVNQPRTHRRAK